MPFSLTLACLWAVSGCLVSLGPQRFHWPAAWGLIAVGIPIVGYVTLQLGPWWGIGVMAAGASILRWPVFYFGRWIRRVFGPQA
ncbi:DUF2484 family protein [Rhodobacterales bacterium HKCCE3408]|nr:DUF2484 family protein [Rhodobacterales bacterium HKCCE3408]